MIRRIITLIPCLGLVVILGCGTPITDQVLVNLQGSNVAMKTSALKLIATPPSPVVSFFGSIADEGNGKDREAAAILVDLLKKKMEAKDLEILIMDALGALSRKKIPVPSEVLVARLSDSEPLNVQLSAVQALGRIRARDAILPLINLLDTADTPKKYYIIWALGEIGDSAAVPALNKLMLSEQNQFVKYNATRALTKIGLANTKAPTDGPNLSQAIRIGQALYGKYQRLIATIRNSG